MEQYRDLLLLIPLLGSRMLNYSNTGREISTRPVLAILAADIHLSHKPPLIRTAEEDWYEAMSRPLRELQSLCQTHQAPCVIAGDIFDDGWRPHKCPPSLINLALRELPDRTYAVAGNHDLPYHRYEEVQKSAFWTLVQAGKIIPLEYKKPLELESLSLHGFPWGYDPEPIEKHDLEGRLFLAVIHVYVWSAGRGYPGAPEESRVKNFLKKVEGFDSCVTGDNHIPISWNLKKENLGTSLFNPGVFLRRKSDEVNHQPRIGLLGYDGSVEIHYLDTSQDKLLDLSDERLKSTLLKTEEFLQELTSLGDSELDFESALREEIRKDSISPKVSEIILSTLEKRK